MLRESDPRVESYTSEAVLGTKTTFAVFVPVTKKGGKLPYQLPVVLFQTGYGSTTTSTAPFLEGLAAEGFLVIAPDHSDDLRCGFCGLLGFLSACSCSALAVDGSNLQRALAYAKEPANKWMDRADLSKVAIVGFSMGAHEVINTHARSPEAFKAAALLSGSGPIPLANVIAWNLPCAPCAGSSCSPCCSDTPVTPCGLGQALRAFDVPTLVVTSESDLAMGGAYRAASILAEKGVGTLVTFKESVLDLSAPTTAGHTAWGPLLAMGGCYGTPFHGLARHFAIIEDADGVTSSTVASFLKPALSGGKAMAATDKMVDDALNTKAAMNFCTPFPLVRRSPPSPGALPRTHLR